MLSIFMYKNAYFLSIKLLNKSQFIKYTYKNQECRALNNKNKVNYN